MPFQLEEATIAQLHDAIRAGETTCVKVVEHYLARVRAFNGVASQLVTRDGRRCRAAGRHGARRRAAEIPHRDTARLALLSGARQIQRPAARIRPHGADRVRSVGAAAVRHDRRHPERGPGECARRRSTSAASARSPARAISTGILRSGRCRRARRRSARYFRHLPDALEARRRARCAVRPQSRSREDADVRRRVLVQGSVRHEGHALDRRRRCRLRHRLSGARSHPRRATAQQGRDHLRQGGEHRIQRPRRRSRRTAHARQGAALDARLSAQHVGRQSVESVRHDALGLAWLELGIGVSVSANFVMASLGEETRASCRGPSNHNSVALLLPHKAMLGFDGGAIGADIYCDRSGIHCPHIEDCAKVLDALKDPSQRLLRSARCLHDRAALVGAADILRERTRGHAGDAGALKGMRHRHRARVDGASAGLEGASEPIVDAAATRDQRRCSARMLGATLVESSDPLWTPDPEIEQMTVDFRKALARLVPVFMPDISVPPRRRRASRCFRNSPRRSCRPNSCPAKCSARARCSRSTTWSGWPRDGSAARRISISRPIQQQELAIRVPLPYLAISDPPRRRLEARRLHAKRSTTWPRSMRARSSGATTSAPRSRTGRRSPIRAIRWTDARASTSASCCASCCAAST